jgi:hypothetical protein
VGTFRAAAVVMSQCADPGRDSPPIIICGFPRTGTTFLQALLNSHPEIHISREYRFRALFATPLLCAQAGLLHRRETEQWRGMSPDEARVSVLRALWYHGEPEGLVARRFGNKTPGNERHFWFFESVFRRTPPRYIYAARDPVAAIGSYRRMSWGESRSVWRLSAQLGRSLRAMRRFQARHPDRLLVAALDRVATDADRRSFVQRIFRFIRETPTREVWRFVDDWPAVNPGPGRAEASSAEPAPRPRRSLRSMQRQLGYV